MLDETMVARAIIREFARLVPGAIVEVEDDMIFVTGRHPDGGLVTHQVRHCLTADEIPAFEAHCKEVMQARKPRQ